MFTAKYASVMSQHSLRINGIYTQYSGYMGVSGYNWIIH